MPQTLGALPSQAFAAGAASPGLALGGFPCPSGKGACPCAVCSLGNASPGLPGCVPEWAGGSSAPPGVSPARPCPAGRPQLRPTPRHAPPLAVPGAALLPAVEPRVSADLSRSPGPCGFSGLCRTHCPLRFHPNCLWPPGQPGGLGGQRVPPLHRPPAEAEREQANRERVSRAVGGRPRPPSRVSLRVAGHAWPDSLFNSRIRGAQFRAFVRSRSARPSPPSALRFHHPEKKRVPAPGPRTAGTARAPRSRSPVWRGLAPGCRGGRSQGRPKDLNPGADGRGLNHLHKS
ncbi:sterile alpha motif domain-containing protein 1-like [Lutra lutra]|uniref:sterile alpha motif domain-containing protein 1-like n=1 Tax=Lutra lutra TaxID=9657 RepID=UPI001FCFCDF5|nr:sterile alpha motif domain-containing protein 1-like [Lutra lutra]